MLALWLSINPKCLELLTSGLVLGSVQDLLPPRFAKIAARNSEERVLAAFGNWLSPEGQEEDCNGTISAGKAVAELLLICAVRCTRLLGAERVPGDSRPNSEPRGQDALCVTQGGRSLEFRQFSEPLLAHTAQQMGISAES
jgi:hypothetical protein